MTGIMLAPIRGRASTLDTSALSVNGTNTGATATASATFNTDGTITAGGTNPVMIPDPARWWTGTPPAAVWISYTSTGTGTITGGLAADTRYQLTTARTIGNSAATVGLASRTFTLSFHDAATGGNLLGTKTYTAEAERL